MEVARREPSMLLVPSNPSMLLLKNKIHGWAKDHAKRATLVELSDEDRKELEECFTALAESGKDYLELKAFKKAADTVLGPDKYNVASLRDAVLRIDIVGNGRVSWNAFRAYMAENWGVGVNSKTADRIIAAGGGLDEEEIMFSTRDGAKMSLPDLLKHYRRRVVVQKFLKGEHAVFVSTPKGDSGGDELAAGPTRSGPSRSALSTRSVRSVSKSGGSKGAPSGGGGQASGDNNTMGTTSRYQRWVAKETARSWHATLQASKGGQEQEDDDDQDDEDGEDDEDEEGYEVADESYAPLQLASPTASYDLATSKDSLLSKEGHALDSRPGKGHASSLSDDLKLPTKRAAANGAAPALLPSPTSAHLAGSVVPVRSALRPPSHVRPRLTSSLTGDESLGAKSPTSGSLLSGMLARASDTNGGEGLPRLPQRSHTLASSGLAGGGGGGPGSGGNTPGTSRALPAVAGGDSAPMRLPAVGDRGPHRESESSVASSSRQAEANSSSGLGKAMGSFFSKFAGGLFRGRLSSGGGSMEVPAPAPASRAPARAPKPPSTSTSGAGLNMSGLPPPSVLRSGPVALGARAGPTSGQGAGGAARAGGSLAWAKEAVGGGGGGGGGQPARGPRASALTQPQQQQLGVVLQAGAFDGGIGGSMFGQVGRRM